MVSTACQKINFNKLNIFSSSTPDDEKILSLQLDYLTAKIFLEVKREEYLMLHRRVFNVTWKELKCLKI